VKNAFKNVKIIRGIPISMPPSLFARPESYLEDLFLAMILTAVESIRTQFSGGTA
jgi:hypothetical protein